MSEELTQEEIYQAEYEKAWSDDEEEVLEQPEVETESEVDVPETVEAEDSKEDEITDEVQQDEESDTKDEEQPKNDFAEVLKWNKQEIPVTREELIALAQKGFDSDKKWREAAVDRPLKEIISKHNITAEELTMFADALRNKNAEALAMMANKAGIDLYDAEHKSYKPVVEDRNYELDDVIAEINRDEAIATQMNDYVSSVPQSVKNMFVSKPEVLRGLNIDMQKGIAQKVMPEVIKQLAINPNQDFVRLYQEIGTVMFSKQEEVKQTRPQPTREEKKRVSVPIKNTAPKKSVADDYDSVWDDDKHFNAVLARLNGF